MGGVQEENHTLHQPQMLQQRVQKAQGPEPWPGGVGRQSNGQ